MLRDDHNQPVAAVRDVGKRASRIGRVTRSKVGAGNAVLTGSAGSGRIAYVEGGASAGVSRVSRTTSATRFMVVRRSIAAR